MNAITPPRMEKFAIGQPVSRKEDPMLLRGDGSYSDDQNLPGQLYAVIVRSRYAHGILNAIDTTEARAMPGVHAVLTAADLRAGGIKHMAAAAHKNADGSEAPRPPQMPLAEGRVRYVGDPVACVIAETPAQAKDAADAVLLDIESLPAITTARAADAPGAPLLHDEAPGNVLMTYHHGDAAAVAAAFAKAAHVTKLSIRNSRIVVAAMEPRSALAAFEDNRFVLRVGCQGVFGLRDSLKNVLGVPVEAVRVLTGNVGGSFGMKASVYPEYPCLLLAAKLLGRPVKWTDERSDSFLSDSHGRDHECDAEMALAADGAILATRFTVWGNMGAYMSNATTIPPTSNTMKNSIGVYAHPLVEVTSRCMFTNTTPVGPYRGAGRPEGNYYMERLIDTAAAEMGLDRVDLRRRNHIQPNQIPYTTPAGTIYDSGDFPTVMDKALAAADWDGYPARAKETRSRGKIRGRGVGQYLEVTAPPSSEMGGITFGEDGTVTITTGTLDYGQGHASPFAQVLCDRLGVPFDSVRLFQGDSDKLIAGGGTGGSKSLMASGAAIVEASVLCIEAGKQAASEVLEASVADIEFSSRAGEFRIAGTDRAIGIMALAAQRPGTLDVQTIHDGAPSAYPNGCHVCEIELDPETGIVEVVKYSMVNDFGVMVNPMLVEGQAHGGIVQGIGQALLEAMAYDEDGQLQTGSFMDYAVPHAVHAPNMPMGSHPVPAKTNVLGAKGCGEAGCAGALPAVMNALVDALRPLGIAHIDMPATPERVWQAIQHAQIKQAA